MPRELRTRRDFPDTALTRAVLREVLPVQQLTGSENVHELASTQTHFAAIGRRRWLEGEAMRLAARGKPLTPALSRKGERVEEFGSLGGQATEKCRVKSAEYRMGSFGNSDTCHG